jgi:hypothetical protein
VFRLPLISEFKWPHFQCSDLLKTECQNSTSMWGRVRKKGRQLRACCMARSMEAGCGLLMSPEMVEIVWGAE